MGITLRIFLTLLVAMMLIYLVFFTGIFSLMVDFILLICSVFSLIQALNLIDKKNGYGKYNGTKE